MFVPHSTTNLVSFVHICHIPEAPRSLHSTIGGMITFQFPVVQLVLMFVWIAMPKSCTWRAWFCHATCHMGDQITYFVGRESKQTSKPSLKSVIALRNLGGFCNLQLCRDFSEFCGWPAQAAKPLPDQVHTWGTVETTLVAMTNFLERGLVSDNKIFLFLCGWTLQFQPWLTIADHGW